MFQNIKVVTFDAAGTLIIPHPSVGEVYAEVLRGHGVNVDPAEIDRLFHEALRGAQSRVRENINEETEKEFWSGIVWDTIGNFCPKERFPAVFEEIYDTFASASRWRTLPDAGRTLGTLQRRRYRLALLSNSDSRFRKVFADLEIDAFFEELFLSSEVGFEKPDLRIFRHVEERLSVEPEEILHVGDSRIHDAAGAASANWNYLILDPKRASADPSTIRTLSDLPALLPGN